MKYEKVKATLIAFDNSDLVLMGSGCPNINQSASPCQSGNHKNPDKNSQTENDMNNPAYLD